MAVSLNRNEIKKRTAAFSKKYKDESREKAESQTFWNDFFNIFDVDRYRVATYELHVNMLSGAPGFIDMFWPGKLIVEHKSEGKSLDDALKQALDYLIGVEKEKHPRYIITSDFQNFLLYDLGKKEELRFKLENLVDNIDYFGFIADYHDELSIKEQDPVNIQAAELMGKLHDKLLETNYKGHKLEVYLVRLLFCMFADDTGIFRKDDFLKFIINYTKKDGSDLDGRLHKLFEVLNTPEDERSSILDEDLAHFCYINGKLFEEKLDTPSFNSEMRDIIIECCQLNWSNISPAIFGSLFQSVMEPKERRNYGAHYTSEKNILKLIKPLFLDELWDEFYKVRNHPQKLNRFHDKLANLKFFDPACGCGNFLIIAYRELRKLEIEVLTQIYADTEDTQQSFDIKALSQIDVDAFYGIELCEFPARIAEVAMWMIDHQMNKIVSNRFGTYYSRLPLKKSANITIGNALRIEWNTIIPQEELFYILGNPPFAGKSLQTDKQKEDMSIAFEGVNYKNLDYVSGWYIKAARYVQGSKIKVGFVSTNSISQGEQVGLLWNRLLNDYNIKIHFAHRTFKWTNKAKGQAAVFVVIIGFANFDIKNKFLFEYDSPTSEAYKTIVKNINPYLVEGDDLVILKRSKPICDVPKMVFGSKLVDGGNLTLNDVEKDALIKKEPISQNYIKPMIGGQNYLNNKSRWVLWLKDIKPNDLRRMPEVYKRVVAVKEFRLKSKKAKTVEDAERPNEFAEPRQPENNYVLVPRTTSEKRKYVPISFFSPDYIIDSSVTFIPDANLYDFGVLSSIIHMSWMRYTAGRLESRYRYSGSIVYNNFPWPKNPSKNQIRAVKLSSDKILKVRDDFPESSLADLYDPNSMPARLLKAHKKLDKAVASCYGIKKYDNETKTLEVLFKLYEDYILKK